MAITIGIDLGGTRIKAVVRNPKGEVSHFGDAMVHGQDNEVWRNLCLRIVQQVREELGPDIQAIGISAPGIPDSNQKAIAYMPGRMAGLENFYWEEFLGCPAFVLNDGIAALMAESRAGVALNRKNVIMVTLGTGVGGGILIEGQPYMGSFGKAGHIGHMVICDQESPDITGMPGSLEDAIGDCSLAKRSHQRFCSTRDLVNAHLQGDVFASEVWLKSLRKLAIGLSSLTNILSPEMIVLSGGITQAGDALFTPLRKFMDLYEWKAGGNGTCIAKADQGEWAGALGALIFAEEKLKLIQKA